MQTIRVVNVLWKLVADCLADFHVRLAHQIVRGREAAEVGHGLQVPDDLAELREVSFDPIECGDYRIFESMLQSPRIQQ